jgi:hypothetical protein
MSLRHTAIAAVAAVSIFTHAAASAGVEEQKPVINTDPQDGDFDSYWTDSRFYTRAETLMKESPLIDTHIDLPQIVRSLGR